MSYTRFVHYPVIRDSSDQSVNHRLTNVVRGKVSVPCCEGELSTVMNKVDSKGQDERPGDGHGTRF